MLAEPTLESRPNLRLAKPDSDASAVAPPRLAWVDLTRVVLTRVVAMFWVVTIHVSGVPT